MPRVGHVLHILWGRDLLAVELTPDGYNFAGICGISDCRPLTATFTPHASGAHRVLVAVYTYTAGLDPAIEGYVELRANGVVGAPR